MGISVKLCFVDERRLSAVDRAKHILKRVVENEELFADVQDMSLTSESADRELAWAILSFSAGDTEYMCDVEVLGPLLGPQYVYDRSGVEDVIRDVADELDCLVEYEDLGCERRYRHVFDAQGELMHESDSTDQNYDWTNKDYGKKKIEEFIPTWMIRKTLSK